MSGIRGKKGSSKQRTEMPAPPEDVALSAGAASGGGEGGRSVRGSGHVQETPAGVRTFL